MYVAFFFFCSHTQFFIYLLKLLYFGGRDFYFSPLSGLLFSAWDNAESGPSCPLFCRVCPGRTRRNSDRLISLAGSIIIIIIIFSSFFFFPFFPLGVERWLGVYFRRWEGDRFCNNKPAFLPAARDEWLWNLQTWLPTSAEKEAARIEGKKKKERFISFRLGGSANFPGAKSRGVNRTAMKPSTWANTFFPSLLSFFSLPFLSWVFFFFFPSSTSCWSRIQSLQKFVWTIPSQTECGLLFLFCCYFFF